VREGGLEPKTPSSQTLQLQGLGSTDYHLYAFLYAFRINLSIQSLGNYRPSLKSSLSTKKRISRRTGSIFVIKVNAYDTQVFPILAHIRSAAMAKIMPAEILQPYLLNKFSPSLAWILRKNIFTLGNELGAP
jgi:hypothetical protein